MHRNSFVLSLMALFLLASVPAIRAADDKIEVKGMIISRTGETLLVKSPEGTVTVVLTDGTTTKDDRGLFGLAKEKMSSVVLIPGLKVDVDGTNDPQGRVVAKVITVDGDDLETAEMIQSGLHPTAQQVAANVQAIENNQQNIGANRAQIAANQQAIAANRAQLAAAQGGVAANASSIEAAQQSIAAHQEKIEKSIGDIEENSNRFAALSEFDVKGEVTVKFNVNSSRISAEEQAQLSTLAQTATGLTGYIVEVMGYADSTGSAAMNTKLSEDRAKAVITYLLQQGNIPVRHIVAPGAMGEYGAAASNETSAGRAENRRVVVKILVNKGIAGK
jgi:OmpA-OmpF porin, OOP family